MDIKRIVLGAAAAALLVPAAFAQEVTITNARIFVGNGQVIDNGAIVVQGGKIVSVAAGKPARTVGRVIDAHGQSAMPGFIDAHRHLTFSPDAATEMHKLLEAGFTTVLSGGALGGRGGNPYQAVEQAIQVRDQIDKGEFVGPRLIPSGNVLFLAAGQTPDTVRADIRKLSELGVKYTGEMLLTPVPGPTPAELAILAAALAEGAKDGVRVQVHAVSTSAMMGAVNAHIKLLVHVPNKDWVTTEQAAQMKADGVHILSAAGTWAPVFGVFANDNKPRARDGKPWPEGITDGVGGGKEIGYALVNNRTLYDAGVSLGIGMDTTYEPREGLRVELRSLDGALSPTDIMKMIGQNSADYLDMGDQIGSLEVGKQADIVLLNGNPLDGYEEWLKVTTVLKGGKIVIEPKG
jgi:imidazolonepropionase-like amidohydrolase